MSNWEDDYETAFVKRAGEIIVTALLILTGCSLVIISFGAWLLVME